MEDTDSHMSHTEKKFNDKCLALRIFLCSIWRLSSSINVIHKRFNIFPVL